MPSNVIFCSCECFFRVRLRTSGNMITKLILLCSCTCIIPSVLCISFKSIIGISLLGNKINLDVLDIFCMLIARFFNITIFKKSGCRATGERYHLKYKSNAPINSTSRVSWKTVIYLSIYSPKKIIMQLN